MVDPPAISRAARGAGPRDLLLFTEAWLTLALTDLGIRLLPYSRWRGWLVADAGPEVPPDHRGAAACALAIERAARRHLLPQNCLRRTLALRRMLLRRGCRNHLHIGVRAGEKGLEAHAWLSAGGRILNDHPDVVERYAELGGANRLDTLLRQARK